MSQMIIKSNEKDIAILDLAILPVWEVGAILTNLKKEYPNLEIIQEGKINVLGNISYLRNNRIFHK